MRGASWNRKQSATFGNGGAGIAAPRSPPPRRTCIAAHARLNRNVHRRSRARRLLHHDAMTQERPHPGQHAAMGILLSQARGGEGAQRARATAVL